MTEQLLLPGMEPANPGASVDNLFVAIFPSAENAKRISNLGVGLKDLLGVEGKLRPESHLHATMYHVGTYRDGLPESHVSLAKRSCEAAALLSRSLEATFNRVLTFQGGEGRNPFVLSGTSNNSALHFLHKTLVAEFARQGFRVGRNSNFEPHVTLAYAKEPVGEVPIEPIGCTVDELVLIHSLVGQTKYSVLGRWPLIG